MAEARTLNLYEEAARTRKAVALFCQARGSEVTAEEVAHDRRLRERLALMARVRQPSSATWAVVVTLLEEAEHRDASSAALNVFGGLSPIREGVGK